MSGAGAVSPYGEYVAHWLAHEPELRLAHTLVAAVREPRHEALRVLDTLLLDAALEVRDAAVAHAKLDWWRAELAAAAAGGARHPVSRRLAELDALDARGAAALLEAAAAIAALESPRDLAALHEPFRSYARASLGAGAPSRSVEALGAALLAMRLRRWPGFASASRARIPLALLAELGVARDALLRDPRAAAATLAALAAALSASVVVPPSGDPALDARLDCARHLLDALRRAPADAIGGGTRARALPLLLALWRTARRGAAA